MKETKMWGGLLAGLVLAATSSACGSSDGSVASAPNEAGASAGGAVLQTPPMGATAIKAWLDTGAYKTWHCEAAVHVARSPSPHNIDRVCSNDVVANNATAGGPWPEGAAAVKELYASATDTMPAGYAVYLKTQPESANGANWYYYGSLTAGGPPVDGMGDSTTIMAECTGCHLAAGSDAAHTPSAGGRDEVYTPVH